MKNADSRRRAFSSKASKAKAGLVVLSAVSAVLTSNHSYGATDTWTDASSPTNSNWSDSTNWIGGVPGAADTAYFDSTPATNVVNVDTATQDIANITIDTATATNFAIGATANTGNSLFLSNGGEIQVTSSVSTATSETINAPLVLEGSSYTFLSNSLASSTGLQIAGNVTGGDTGVATVLTLDGTNTTSSTTSSTAVIGNISNGTASSLSIVKNGSGLWELRGTNTYTGSTTINATTSSGGGLRITNAGALPATTDVIINGTGLLRLSATGTIGTGTFPAVNSIDSEPSVLDSAFATGAQSISMSSNCGISVNNTTGINGGAAWTIDAVPLTSDPKYSFTLDLTGTTNGTDGITLINGASTPKVSYGSSTAAGMDLGPANRIFNIDHGGVSLTTTGNGNSADFQVNARITGAGGIIKTGAGIMVLNNPAGVQYTFTGPVEVQAGTLQLIGTATGGFANPLIGTNPLTVDGGILNLNGMNATFGPATFTGGSTTLSTTSAATAATQLIAPSYTFNVPTAGTFSMGDLMTDDGSPSPVVSNGAGTVTIRTDTVNGLSQNNYTGGTTINAGTFIFSTPGSLPVAGNIANNANVQFGGNSTAGNVTGSGITTVNTGVTFVANGFTQTGGLVNNGSTLINGNGTVGPISGTGTLTIGSGTANTLQLAHNSGLSTQTALVITAGSTLDVTNNHVIINYTGLADPSSTIYSYLKTGYSGGTWTGIGIDSSTAALPANNAHYGVGFVDGADHIPGSSVTSGQIEVAYALYGDVNLDGLVNATDFAVFGANFNKAITGWEHGDFTYTGLVNGTDFALLGSNFGKSASGTAVSLPAGDYAALDAFAAANGLSLPSVPEPASLGLLTLGAIGMLGRRRRRSNV